jgi:aspartokinase
MLARGAVSLRALARWMIQTQGWKGVREDAVVSAIRRYPKERVSRTGDYAKSVLARSHVNRRSNACTILLPKTHATHKALAEIIASIDPSRGELIRIIEGERAIRVIVDANKLENLRSTLSTVGNLGPRREIESLVEHSIVFPADAEVTPALLAVIFSALAAHDIKILESVAGTHEHLIFTSEEQSRKAFQVLVQLTRGSA